MLTFSLSDGWMDGLRLQFGVCLMVPLVGAFMCSCTYMSLQRNCHSVDKWSLDYAALRSGLHIQLLSNHKAGDSART